MAIYRRLSTCDPLRAMHVLQKHVCKLKSSLYGLNEAPQAWFDKFRHAILQANFYRSENDSFRCIRRTSGGCTVLLIYVNDVFISGNDSACIAPLKTHLMRCFMMKDLGSFTYFLVLKTSKNHDSTCVHQHKYVEDIK